MPAGSREQLAEVGGGEERGDGDAGGLEGVGGALEAVMSGFGGNWPRRLAPSSSKLAANCRALL